MSDHKDGRPTSAEAYRHGIAPIGRGPIGWAIERDGRIWRSGPRREVLGAWLDGFLAGASSWDADDIAKVIERRPEPSRTLSLSFRKAAAGRLAVGGKPPVVQ